MILRKKLLVLNTTLMLGLGSVIAPAVSAESLNLNDLQNQKQLIENERTGIQSEIDKAVAEIKSLQEEQALLVNRIQSIELAISDNTAKIDETKVQIDETNVEIEKLQKEITALQDKIEKRNEILKERAVSYQESGGSVNYLEVLLGSESFGDLIERVGAVTTLVEADREILEQQENDKKELEEKKTAVETKLSELEGMKVELEGMLAQIEEQKSQSVQLSKNLQAKETQTATLIGSLENKDAALAAQVSKIQQDMMAEQKRQAEMAAAQKRAEEAAAKQAAVAIAAAKNTTAQKSSSESKATVSSSSSAVKSTTNKETTKETTKKPASNNSEKETATAPSTTRNLSVAITAGNKYIGNSVYVFGGGRSSSDIANGRFDCSAFVHWAYAQAGINLGSSGSVNTESLKNYGTQIPASQMQPGDMVFFDTYKKDGHVGIYVGNGKFIGAQSSTGVAIANMSSGYWAQKFNGRVIRL
jgi:peptidoglycan DL-endopeptidase CwlO